MAAPNIVNVATITAKTVGSDLNTTVSTTMLQNSASSGKVFKINTIIVANKDGSNAADATVSYFNGSSTFYLAYGITVPADSTLVVIDKNSALYLEENTQIRAGASATGDLQIIISYEEIS